MPPASVFRSFVRTACCCEQPDHAYLLRNREISLQANLRYLDVLTAVDDPTPCKRALQRLTTTKKDAAGRSCPGSNPLAQHDATLFKSLMADEHCLHGFTNRDIRARSASTQLLHSCAKKIAISASTFGYTIHATSTASTSPVPPRSTGLSY